MNHMFEHKYAHEDRLRDANIKPYERKTDFKARRREQKETTDKRLHVVLATIINLMTK